MTESKPTDSKIKEMATKQARNVVIENMNSPQDIFAECSDGMWVRRVWKNPNGYFGWGKWKRA